MMYQLAVIDPPWPQRKGGVRKVAPSQGRDLPYRTMSIPDIAELLDRDLFTRLTAENSVFLWAIDKFLWNAEQMMLDRGYRLHARIVWNKENGVAPGFTVRYSHEYLLWFYQGRFQSVAHDIRGKYSTIIQERSRQHSRKPDAAYKMIDALYPDARKIDVFSREKRKGWDQYGDQVDHFSTSGGWDTGSSHALTLAV